MRKRADIECCTQWFNSCVIAYNTKEGHCCHTFGFVWFVCFGFELLSLRLLLFHAMLIAMKCSRVVYVESTILYTCQVFKINIFTNTVYRVQSQVIKPFTDTQKQLAFRQKDKSEVPKPQSVQFPSSRWAWLTQSQSVIINLLLGQFYCVETVAQL